MEYKRVLVKLTGEAFKKKDSQHTLHMYAAEKIAKEIISAHEKGIEIAIVVGGGNIVRGRELGNIQRVVADQMGMLATIINALYLQEILEKSDKEVRTLSAINVKDFTEPFIRKRAIRHLEKGRIVIFAGGTGNPYFSTDQAAIVRALEIKADAVFKGTKVDGIYKTPRSKKIFTEISCKEIQKLHLEEIIDNTALSLIIQSKEKLPIHVFNIFEKGNLLKVLQGEKIGTKIVP